MGSKWVKFFCWFLALLCELFCSSYFGDFELLLPMKVEYPSRPTMTPTCRAVDLFKKPVSLGVWFFASVVLGLFLCEEIRSCNLFISSFIFFVFCRNFFLSSEKLSNNIDSFSELFSMSVKIWSVVSSKKLTFS